MHSRSLAPLMTVTAEGHSVATREGKAVPIRHFWNLQPLVLPSGDRYVPEPGLTVPLERKYRWEPRLRRFPDSSSAFATPMPACSAYWRDRRRWRAEHHTRRKTVPRKPACFRTSSRQISLRLLSSRFDLLPQVRRVVLPPRLPDSVAASRSPPAWLIARRPWLFLGPNRRPGQSLQ